ncbi:hypothetical protein ACFX13_028254 [Malus domestica]
MEAAVNTSRNVVEVIIEGVDDDVNVVVGASRVVVGSTEGVLEECLKRAEWVKSHLRDPRSGRCSLLGQLVREWSFRVLVMSSRTDCIAATPH